MSVALEDKVPVDDWAEPSDDGSIDYGDGNHGSVEPSRDEASQPDPIEQPIADEVLPSAGSDSAKPASQPAVRESDDKSPVAEFAPELLEQAGLTPEQARAYGSPEALQAAVLYHNRQLLEAGRRQREQQHQQSHQQPQPVQQPIPATKSDAPLSIGQQSLLPTDGVNADGSIRLPEEVSEFDESTQKILGNLTSQFNEALKRRDQQIGEFQQLIQHAVEERQQESLRQFANDFDEGIRNLPEPWKKLFGEGPGIDLPPDSPAIKARLDAADALMMIQHQRRSRGLPELSSLAAIESAAQAAFPDHYKSVIESQVSDRLRNKRGQFTSRPSARRTQGNPTPEDGANQFVANFMSERGVNPGDYETDDNDWL